MTVCDRCGNESPAAMFQVDEIALWGPTAKLAKLCEASDKHLCEICVEELKKLIERFVREKGCNR